MIAPLHKPHCTDTFSYSIPPCPHPQFRRRDDGDTLHAGEGLGQELTFNYYDNLGRPTAITDNTSRGGLIRYGYAGLYLESKTYGNGANGAFQMVTSDLEHYDSFGRLTTCHYRKGGDCSGLVLLKYKYDDASNITWRYDHKMQADHSKNWSQKYTYDTLHRLAQAEQGEVGGTWPSSPTLSEISHTWTWDDFQANGPELDKLGNWLNFDHAGTTDARTHDLANEITARTTGGNSRIISYDVAGNLHTLQDETGNTGWRYTYDYRNRLIKVESTEDITGDPELVDWDPVATYAYDALNRRVKKHLTSGNDIMYTYDGWRCIEESEDVGGQWVAMRQYVYGAQYLDELVARDDLGASPETYFFLQDTNCNVIALYKLSAASIVERYWYEPYGKVTFADGDGGNQGSPINEVLLFQGQRRDPETGLYYFKNRYYSPGLGRFLQRDPIHSGMNDYDIGNPVSSTDPLGLERRFLNCSDEQEKQLNKALDELQGRIDDFIGMIGEQDGKKFIKSKAITKRAETIFGKGFIEGIDALVNAFQKVSDKLKGGEGIGDIVINCGECALKPGMSPDEPASYNARTGQITVGSNIFFRLTDLARVGTLFHELLHSVNMDGTYELSGERYEVFFKVNEKPAMKGTYIIYITNVVNAGKDEVVDHPLKLGSETKLRVPSAYEAFIQWPSQKRPRE